MKYFLVLLCIIAFISSMRVLSHATVEPEINATAPGNQTEPMQFADGDDITIAASEISQIFLLANTTNCSQSDQPCGSLEAEMENNPEARFTLRALQNMADAFCIGRENKFIFFDPKNCTESQNNSQPVVCAMVQLMNSQDCKEDFAFRFNRTNGLHAIQSAKYPNLYLHLDIDNCRGIMNQPSEGANNTTSNNTSLEVLQRCGTAHMMIISNLQDMLSNEDVKEALFNIQKANTAGEATEGIAGNNTSTGANNTSGGNP